MYGYRCDVCGCYLDPGEQCDCRKEATMEAKERPDPVKITYQSREREACHAS